MNQRDLATLRRRLNPENRFPSLLRGCYLTPEGEIMSAFVKEVAALPQDEYEKYLAIFKKIYSGTQGQNMLPVPLGTNAGMEDEAQQLLLRLSNSSLRDDEAIDLLFGQVIESVHAEAEARAQSIDETRKADNRLVLLLGDTIDLRHRRSDGEEDPDRSETQFSYILCAVCPVKPTKPTLAWCADDQDFVAKPENWTVSSPEMGFLFPAMEEGGADIGCAMLYTKSAENTHEGFVRKVFQCEPLQAADDQRSTVQDVLTTALAEECSLDVVQAVHEQLTVMLAEQKEDKQAEPLQLSRKDMREVLEGAGVSQEKAEAFEQGFTDAFGSYGQIPAVNVMPTRQYKVSTPDVTITVAPDKSELVQTRMIDGLRYILIRAEGGVEVNGIPVV